MAPQSLSAITRALIPLENQGGEQFFGEPMLDVTDWIRTDASGRGMINILHAVETVKYPKLYAAFLLWMMAELFENLPEVGDPVTAGEPFGDVESVKAVSDLVCPVSGEVCEINEELLDSPELLNSDPYGAWIIRVKDVTGYDEMITAAEYEAFVSEEG
jgi:hypothetical protein